MPTATDMIIIILLVCVISLITIMLVRKNQEKSILSEIPNELTKIESNLDDKTLNIHNEINQINLNLENKFSNLRSEFSANITSMQTALSGLLNTQISEGSKKEIEKIDLLVKTLSDQFNSVKVSVDNNTNQTESKLENMRLNFNTNITNMQTVLSTSLNNQMTDSSKKEMEKIDLLIKTLTDQLNGVKVSVENNTTQTENKLESIRLNFNTNITNMQTALSTSLNNQMTEESTKQREKLDLLIKTLSNQLISVKASIDQNTNQTETKLENIRLNVEKSIKSLETENSSKLDEMRKVVDDKLQKTLDDKLSKSFQIVNDSLKQVYQGLGDMQTLASGVGDLKKVLSNVKTRGILGETQLGSILEQILAKEQYEMNIITKKGSKDPVEFAIKMPGDDNGYIYLPIDAKFPLDTYTTLLDAYDKGNADEIKVAKASLITKIKKFGKDISEKYIDVPNTTDFGIMFLPVEGLYAEVVQTGVTEDLQRDYKINVAGPTTMAALLNSLQMGFKTLAIQKRSGEVWKVLGAVKTEFNNFEKVLESTQSRLNQASEELEKLVGVRTRKIQRKLNEVTILPGIKTDELLDLDEDSDEIVKV